MSVFTAFKNTKKKKKTSQKPFPYNSNSRFAPNITSKNRGKLGLVLKMENIAYISILLTKHVKYTYLYLFKFCYIQYFSI